MPAGCSKLLISISSVVPGLCDIGIDDVERRALLMDHVRDISEQLIELPDGLLDVSNLRLAFDDQAFLEIHFRLICEVWLILDLLLLLLLLAVSLPG